jgi:hypothetical protein
LFAPAAAGRTAMPRELAKMAGAWRDDRHHSVFHGFPPPMQTVVNSQRISPEHVRAQIREQRPHDRAHFRSFPAGVCVAPGARVDIEMLSRSSQLRDERLVLGLSEILFRAWRAYPARFVWLRAAPQARPRH